MGCGAPGVGPEVSLMGQRGFGAEIDVGKRPCQTLGFIRLIVTAG